MPWAKGTDITPIAEENKPEQLKDYVDNAITLGATLANEKGGQTLGTLYHPAVLSNVSLDSQIAQEEQFGPVVPVIKYTDAEEVVDFLVQSPFGMQASIFGRDPRFVGPLIDQLANQVCRINLNAQCQRGPDVFPFTGRKSSAEGTLSVYDALRSFSIRSMVAAKQDETGKAVFRDILEGDHSQFLSSKILF
jgi:acyl-CoA reductase-like NAD-dependent aldehyde dehydrogenase